jgi:hypothetical protein
MDIVVALIALAMVVIVAVYVAQPLSVRSRARVEAGESPREKLLAERDSLYAAMRDLDLDFQTGKLLEADYRAMRDTYAARGVEILKALDAAESVDRGPRVTGRTSAAADEIEAAVLARRKPQPASADDGIEAAIRARRQAAGRNPKSETPAPSPGRTGASVRNQCPQCARPIDPSDRFCAKCGAPLAVEATR